MYIYIYIYIYTVPTCNYCTKYVGSQGILHDRTPDCHPVSWTWMRALPPN